MLLLACSVDSTSAPTAQVRSRVNAATVTTNANAYTSSDVALVSYDGLPGNPGDWIALSRPGSAADSYVVWLTAGEVTGSRSFAMTGLSGSYVARAYEDNTYNILAESASFTVTIPGQALTTDKSSYVIGETVNATYAALPGNPKDWIAIAHQGSPTSSFHEWTYVPGASGTFGFAPPSPGTYVIRAFDNDTLTLLIESASFTVGYAKPTTNKSSYTPGETVTASYSGLPGNALDWLAVAPQNAAVGTYVTWAYAGGVNGTQDFTGLAAGTYVVRTFENNSETLLAESDPFTVGWTTTTISTDAASYAPPATVTVSFANLHGNAHDWVTLAPAGSQLTTYGAWAYPGAVSGTYVFSGVPAGSYVARAFEDDGFTLLAESSTFTVVAPTKTLTTSAGTYSSAVPVSVSFTNLPGHATDWIAIAPQGSPNTTYTTWRYLASGAGTEVFTGLAAGNYVARAFADNGFDLLVESDPFTVTAATAVATNQASYTSAENVVVTFGGLAGNQTDWISIAPVGSASGSYQTWAYAYGSVSGSVTFPPLPAGTYTARVFFNDTFTMEAESGQFTVAP